MTEMALRLFQRLINNALNLICRSRRRYTFSLKAEQPNFSYQDSVRLQRRLKFRMPGVRDGLRPNSNNNRTFIRQIPDMRRMPANPQIMQLSRYNYKCRAGKSERSSGRCNAGAGMMVRILGINTTLIIEYSPRVSNSIIFIVAQFFFEFNRYVVNARFPPNTFLCVDI